MVKKIKNRIIITGGSGFIGTNLLKSLIKNGYTNLLVIDKKRPLIKRVCFVKGNFSNIKLLKNTLRNNDIIIHLACTSIPATSELNKEKDIKENIIGTLRLLEVCQEKNIKKFIFISSGGTVYGEIKKPAKETDMPKPINAHGIMKLTIEKYIELFHHLYGLTYVIIRASNLYGRLSNNNRKQGIVDIFLRKVIKNESMEILGNGEIIRDYIYINDLTNLLIKIIKKDAINEIFNAGTGISTSINDLLDIIKNITGQELKIRYLPARSFDLPYSILNIKKAQKMLGWQPKFKIKDGINKIYKNIIKSYLCKKA